jgi:hypothetical protein
MTEAYSILRPNRAILRAAVHYRTKHFKGKFLFCFLVKLLIDKSCNAAHKQGEGEVFKGTYSATMAA